MNELIEKYLGPTHLLDFDHENDVFYYFSEENIGRMFPGEDIDCDELSNVQDAAVVLFRELDRVLTFLRPNKNTNQAPA